MRIIWDMPHSAAVLAWVVRLVLVRRGALHSSPSIRLSCSTQVACAVPAMLSPLPASRHAQSVLDFSGAAGAHNVPTAARAKALALLFLSGLVTVGWAGWQYAAGVGLRVDSAAPGTGFSRAGVQPGDVVMRVDGRLIRRPARFLAYLDSKPPSQPLQLQVVHGGDIDVLKAATPITVPPGEWPHASDLEQLGMQMETARPARALGFYGHYENYAFVLLLLASVAFGLWLGRRELFSASGLLALAVFPGVFCHRARDDGDALPGWRWHWHASYRLGFDSTLVGEIAPAHRPRARYRGHLRGNAPFAGNGAD